MNWLLRGIDIPTAIILWAMFDLVVEPVMLFILMLLVASR